MLKNCLLALGGVIIIVAVYFPTRHARHYNYVAKENIYKEIEVRKPKNSNSNLKTCTYQDLILKNAEIEISSVTDRKTFQRPFAGGEFKPNKCMALIKTALVIPYRNRTQQLDIFLNYMHSFLQKQDIHYRIFVVNQTDTLPFNRAKMLNYGAKLAISLNYDCLILHDVDLLPLNTGNIYACSKFPRHMSSSLDTFRYNLPYLTLFGGAISILSEQYQRINGMSNNFYGWGGEDDDFYRRLVVNGLKPCRFSPEVSRYTMLPHTKEEAKGQYTGESLFTIYGGQGCNKFASVASMAAIVRKHNCATAVAVKIFKTILNCHTYVPVLLHYGWILLLACQDRYKVLEDSVEKHKKDGLNSLPHQYSINLEDLYTHIVIS